MKNREIEIRIPTSFLRILRINGKMSMGRRLLQISNAQRFLLFPAAVRHVQRRQAVTANTLSARDAVLLYKNDKVKPKYFMIISIVSGVQLVFWGYLSYFALTELSDERQEGDSPARSDAQAGYSDHVPSQNPTSDSMSLTISHSTSPQAAKSDSMSLNISHSTSSQAPTNNTASSKLGAMFSSLKWRLALSLLSLSAGLFFAVTASMYPLRVVSKLHYLQPSSTISITTFTPLGLLREIQAPLQNVVCTGERLSSSQLALKVRGHSLHFLMDRRGQYIAPKMFDSLVGSRKRIM